MFLQRALFFLAASSPLLQPSHGLLQEGLDELEMLNMTELADQLREVVEHFKQDDPVGVPGLPIPDPMPVQDIQSKSFIKADFQNNSIYGLSKFRIDQLESNLADMQVLLAFKFDKLEMLGNHTTRRFFSRSSGGYNVTLTDVEIEGIISMDVARDGFLEASDIKMDMSFKQIYLDFKNTGVFGQAMQGLVQGLGSYIFNLIKPYILQEVNNNIQKDINKNIRKMEKTFPNSIPPLDLFVAELRKKMREMDLDPKQLDDYKYNSGLFSLEVTEMWVTGLASFYRLGDVKLSVTNNTMFVESHVSTQLLEGKCQWEVSLGPLYSKQGSTSFTVDFVELQSRLNQTLDVRNRPGLEELNIKVGNMQLRMDGVGTADYLLELMVNVMPNLLRYQLVDALEGILSQKIQTRLNNLDLEEIIEDNLNKLSELSNQTTTSDLSLGSLEDTSDIDNIYEDITD